jgi:hypothetical protein
VTPPSELAQIVADPRLTSDAVRLVLYVRELGPGEHEIDAADLRLLMGCRSSKPVYAARKVAIDRGYLRFREGGQGHSNRYEYVAPQGDLSENRLPHKATYSPPVVEGGDVVPPMVPLHPIAPDAEKALERHDEVLTGCRGPLRDYLRRRVQPPRQASYVHDIASKIEGMGFQWHGTPLTERVRFVNGALNELAATEESTEYKYPPGDPRNLRTKIGILLAERFRGNAKATGTDGKRSTGRRGDPPDKQQYNPTNTWSGEFNG